MARASVGKVALRNSKRRWFRSNPAAPFAQPLQFSDRRSKPKRSADAAPVYHLELLAQAFVLIVLNDAQSFGIVADGPAIPKSGSAWRRKRVRRYVVRAVVAASLKKTKRAHSVNTR